MFVSQFCTYIPETPTDSPKLEFADSLFKRRLSQISRMTIQVIHDLLEKNPGLESSKIVFVSLRGELKRQFQINQSLIEDNEIMPASFSLSVFNTPVAAATISLKLKGGYSVVYPSGGNFRDAFKMAAAPVLAGTEEKIILAYADENIPEEYEKTGIKENNPMAFACVVSNNTEFADGIEISDLNSVSESPVEFLRSLKKF